MKEHECDRPTKVLPRFDPEEAIRIGVGILDAAGAPFALAGRVAVWTYVPPDGQQFTKDVDFAVPHTHTERVAAVARERGYRTAELAIGGFAVRAERLSIDFIDMHPHLDALFGDAVAAAQERPDRLRVGEADVPVVPPDYLIVMKLVPQEDEHERDVEELLMVLERERYGELRELVMRHLGYIGLERLDFLARRIGHPGPGMRRSYRNEDDELAESWATRTVPGDAGKAKDAGRGLTTEARRGARAEDG